MFESMYTPEEVKQNEKWSKLHGSASVVANNITNTYLPLFAISAIQVSNYQLGWINSIPSLISLFILLPGAWWLNHLERKREFTYYVILFNRLAILLIALTPFIDFMNKGLWLILAIGIMNLPLALTNLSWQSFIGDLIPEERRAAFFSERNFVSTIVGLVSTLVVGMILNFFNKSDPLPYQIFFIIAVTFGILEAVTILNHKEHPIKVNETSQSTKVKWYESFRHKPFIIFLICAGIFQFGWQMAWPIFSIYNITIANAPALWISIFSVANLIGQIVSFKWWGRFSEKHGNSKALLFACIGMALTSFCTIWSTNLYYLVVTNIVSGLALSGTTLLLFNQLLHVSPENVRTSCIAYYQMLVAIVGVISPQVGVLFYEEFGLSFSMNTSGVIRILGGVLFFISAIYLGQINRVNRKGKLFM